MNKFYVIIALIAMPSFLAGADDPEQRAFSLARQRKPMAFIELYKIIKQLTPEQVKALFLKHDLDGQTLLMHASTVLSNLGFAVPIVQQLINGGSEINAIDNQGRNALTHALIAAKSIDPPEKQPGSIRGHKQDSAIKNIELLLDHNATIQPMAYDLLNQFSDEQLSAKIVFMFKEHLMTPEEIAHAIAFHQARAPKQNEADKALDEGTWYKIIPLLDKGLINVNYKNQLHGHDLSLLHKAAYLGNVEAVSSLIQHGADVNFQGGSGITPIQAVVDRFTRVPYEHKPRKVHIPAWGAGAYLTRIIEDKQKRGVTQLFDTQVMEKDDPIIPDLLTTLFILKDNGADPNIDLEKTLDLINKIHYKDLKNQITDILFPPSPN